MTSTVAVSFYPLIDNPTKICYTNHITPKEAVMSIIRTTYKSRPALAVTTPAMTALFLPEDGGKLASVTAADGFEFLCQNPAPDYAPLAYDGSYVDSECASFDDMFPTVDPYTPTEGEYAGRQSALHLPVHRDNEESNPPWSIYQNRIVLPEQWSYPFRW